MYEENKCSSLISTVQLWHQTGWWMSHELPKWCHSIADKWESQFIYATDHILIKYSLDLRPIRTAEAFEAVDILPQQTRPPVEW